MTNAISDKLLHRLDVQGFDHIEKSKLAEVAPWLSMAFGVCATLAFTGTVTASPTILVILMPLALLGAIFPTHPIDAIYNVFIRPITKTSKLPKRGMPSRSACGLGTVWLGLTAWAFYSGYMMAGYILGGALTGVATLVATINICIPSIIYRAIFGQPIPRKS